MPPNARAEIRARTVQSYDTDAARFAGGTRELPQEIAKAMDRLAADIGVDATILEIGSAGGRDALALEERGLTVERTDISPVFVDHLVTQGFSAHVLDPLRGDLGGPYDAVWANAVLLHLSRFETPVVAHRLLEAVRPDGRLFATVKEGDGEGWSTHGSVQGARYFTYWRSEQLRDVLGAAGWHVDDLFVRPGRKSVTSPDGTTSLERWIMVHARRP